MRNPAQPARRSHPIEDRLSVAAREVMLSGTQALVRLLLEQRARDAEAGLDTAGFVSGYRGSPLGGVDFALWAARRELEQAAIRFEPGLNEELAASAVWGTQRVGDFDRPRHQGVFGLWYGKNPGLDRIIDVLKHANFEGTAAHGGVLAVTGDDPGATSSTVANQGEQAFIAALSPILYPASIEDMLSLGLAGFALSRCSGLWVGFKLVADLVESSASIQLPQAAAPFVLPADFHCPPDGLNQRTRDTRWAQEERMARFKLPAVRAFARANGLDRTIVEPQARRIAFIAAGKAFRDLSEAFAILGLDHAELARFGVGVRKVALLWPLEDRANAAFLHGFGEVVVVEEKRAVLEPQLRDMAYHWSADARPRMLGKRDEHDRPLIPEFGELDPVMLARLIAGRLEANAILPADRLNRVKARLRKAMPHDPPASMPGPSRIPHFCAGCPHGRSTRLPEGSRAMAGIGCHSMIAWTPGSATSTWTQMGGEGVTWIGTAPFVDTPHVFQNLGDGTYFHSGVLAIRAAVAAGVPITYKILVNAAVAMTGGQPIEGAPDAARIAWQLHAEGVGRIALLTGPGGGFSGTARDLPPGIWLSDRDDLDEVMRTFRDYRGVSAIIYDQICATEKRRLRKKGKAFAREPVVVINERVCEGCGDCSAKSRCVAVRSAPTRFGTKRRIDLSACNTDLSCTDGFCPSFVTLKGAMVQRAQGVALPADAVAKLGEPARAALETGRPYNILIAGVGGSGLITIGALVGMAAHLEGLPVTTLDNTGLARKGGEVTTHVRIGGEQGEAVAPRLPDNAADLLIAGDLVSATTPAILAKLGPQRHAIVLDDAIPVLEQVIDPGRDLPLAAYHERLTGWLGKDFVRFVDASRIAQRALGDTIFTNMILLGAAVQAGHMPVGREAIVQAIYLNNVAVEQNITAFDWGRLVIADPALVDRLLDEMGEGNEPAGDSVEARTAFFAGELTRYQNKGLAERYRAIVDRVAGAERKICPTDTRLALAATENAFKVLAVKDEYEVARLMSDETFHAGLKRRFGPDVRPTFHFAPPFLPRRMTRDGRRAKRAFGPWMIPLLRLLASLRFLRATAFDPFRWQAERRAERGFAETYLAGLAMIAERLSARNHAAAVEFARLPEAVSGYGHIKQPRLDAALRAARDFMPRFTGP
ncbi:MAG: indolepyruvate ferredoxin oxidoreductase family protein [Xanthobacteraceae bacterium]|nr:MAG: indolepyruvate ferredoxin oxidoreductase family protein [Xanthobacteraceae bacterium]